jgi:hypothetical protein
MNKLQKNKYGVIILLLRLNPDVLSVVRLVCR